MKATIKRKLPNSPAPTRASHVDDPREKEYWLSLVEHRERLKNEKKKPSKKEPSKPAGRPTVWTPDKEIKLKRLYKEGKTFKRISQEIALGERTVIDKVTSLVKSGELERRNAKLTPEQKAKVCELRKHGMFLDDIAAHFKCSRYLISKTLREMEE